MANDTQPEEYRDALKSRRDEFVRSRADIVRILSKTVAALPVQIEESERRLGTLVMARDSLSEVLEEVKALDDANWDQADYAAELSKAMRQVENARLEYLSLSAKTPLGADAKAEATPPHASLIPELLSLGSWQLIRLGFCATLPLALWMLLAVLCLGLFILLAMGAL